MKILWRYRNWTLHWESAWHYSSSLPYSFTFINLWVSWKLRTFNITILGLSLDNAYEGEF